MTTKKYGFDYVTPNWRLYDLESGIIIAWDNDGEAFWNRVINTCATLNEIQGFHFD
jgi:hypothetical protein